jgi:hypothetical protein
MTFSRKTDINSSCSLFQVNFLQILHQNAISTQVCNLLTCVAALKQLRRLACFRDDVVFLIFLYQVRFFLRLPL